ncbi:MAG: PAS domain S-box protein, partial [Candidatus Omnitrophica bacterium]|nr:PAS domain S-box protein [Candidatus Omnitrophota bacterium]
ENATGLGKTGEVLIGQRKGNEVVFLNSLRHDKNAAFKRSVVIGGQLGGPIQQAVKGIAGSGQLTDYRGKKVLAAWNYLPELDWGLVTKIDSGEALSGAAYLKKITIFILIITSIFAAFFAFSIADTVASPIKKLSKGAQIIGSGNLEHKVALKSKDEIGQLSRAFDKMTLDLKKNLAELEFERRRFHEVLDALPAYVVLLDRNYHVPFANRYFEEHFGKSEGRRCYEYLFKRSKPCENCETYKVLKTNSPFHWEWLGPNKRNYDIFDFPFKDVDGETIILEMGIDITEQKRTQEAMRQASQYARSLIEASLDPLVTISADGKISDVNEALIKATGLLRQELIGTDFSSYFTEPEKAREGYQQVFEKGFVTDYPLTIRHKDGHMMDVLYHATVYRDEHGAVLGVFAAARDITMRKRIEEELKQYRNHLELLVQERTSQLENTNRQLRQARDYLESIFNYANAPFICWDTNFKITRFNHAFERLTNYKSEEVLGKDLSVLFPSESKEESLGKIKRTLSGEHWEGEEVPILRKDNDIRLVLWNSANIYSEDGKNLLATIAQGQDITVRKKISEALRQSNRELEHRVAERTEELIRAQNELVEKKRLSDIGTLSATVAHELRNPLAAIKMATYNIRRKANNPQLDRHLANIDTKVSESEQIINNLLFYSRLKMPHFENTNIYEVLNECISSVAERFDKYQVLVKKDLKQLQGIMAQVDQLQVKEVFNNILNNAYDAFADHKGEIEVASSVDDSMISIYFKDNGEGIDKEYLERLFNPFFTTKAKGTGLGLAVCMQVMSLHNGKINIESEKGKGTTVTVIVPVRQ